MNVFFRILSYSNNIGRRLTLYFPFSVLGVIFSAFNVLMVIPMLQVLFNKDGVVEVAPPLPEFAFTKDVAIQTFKHYFLGVFRDHGQMGALFFVCSLLVGSIFLANLFRYLERVMATKIRVDLVKNMRMDIFKNVINLHIGYFNSARKGDLISRFTNDVLEVENAVMSSLKSVFKEPITIVVYFALLFAISVKLTLFTLLILPLTGGVLAQIIRLLKRQSIKGQESLGRIVNILDETFSGMRVVKAFNARNYIIKKMDEESEYYRDISKSIAYKNELASPVSEVLGVMIMAGVIYFGGQMVTAKELQPEEFFGFLTFFALIIQPAKEFSNGITSMQRGTAAAKRIFTIIETRPAIENKTS